MSNRKTYYCAAAAGLLAVLAVASAQTAAFARPESGELRETLAGNTLYLRTRGIVVPIAYHPDGRMSGQLPPLAAAVARDMSAKDSGKWWVADGRLCQRWNQWLDGRSHCYEFTRKGETVHWVRDDGRKGTARLGG